MSLTFAPPPGRAVRDDATPRILIVDDSVVARAVIARAVETGGGFVVAGAVASAAAALDLLRHERVDAIVLDIEMPRVSGLVALPELLAAGRGAKVLIVSSAAAEGAATVVEALALGAADTLVKPGAGGLAGRFSATIVEKLQRLLAHDGQDDAAGAAPGRTPLAELRSDAFDIVAIGASTGGIHALNLVLRELPRDFTLPILITQHLPPSFMPYFAAQLAVLAGRPCDVATDCLRIRPGRIVVAPGTAHLRVVSTREGAAIRLSQEPSRSGCLPSVDPMFDSVADTYGARALGVVLSGMGRDGAEGARALIERGAAVVVQDRESSVVWGMPGTVATAGHASAVLSPVEIGRLIVARRRPA